MSDQQDLFPDLAMTTITAIGDDLAPACDRVRALGGVLLGISAKGSTYTITALLPADGATVEQAMNATPPC